MKTVSSRIIYRAIGPHDEDRPQFNCYRPVYTGTWWLVDCLPCTETGEIDPEYSCGVPVHVDGIGEPIGSTRATI